MISRKIRALVDVQLNNCIDSKHLLEGEVTSFRFKNEAEMKALVGLGTIELAHPDATIGYTIPVVSVQPEVEDPEIHTDAGMEMPLTVFDTVQDESELEEVKQLGIGPFGRGMVTMDEKDY